LNVKIVWVNPSFRHYRVPVYKEIKERLQGTFHIIFSSLRTPADVTCLAEQELGESAIPLDDEMTLSFGLDEEGLSNKGFKLAFQPGLIKHLGRIKPDVIIAEGFGQWTPLVYWYALLKRTRLVISYERTAHTERNAGRVRTCFRKVAARFIDAVVCNGQLSKQYCVDILGIENSKIFTGGMAFDPVFLDQLNGISPSGDDKEVFHTKFSPNQLVFLYVGRLVSTKGLFKLLHAWTMFSKNHGEDVSLVLVGSGPAQESLAVAIKKFQLQNVVLFGNAEHLSLPMIYHLADIFVIPTLEDNWSLVVMEAMASGLPILCSQYNGCWPELVKPGINGWVFDPLDAASFEKSLEACWKERSNFDAMGEKSIDIVKDYSPRHAGSAVLQACGVLCTKNDTDE